MSLRNVFHTCATGFALFFTTGCRATDATQPQGTTRNLGDVASVAVSFGRSVGNGLSMLDTVTMVAVVRDFRGNEVTDVPISWAVSLDVPMGPGDKPASIVPTGPRTALLTMESDYAVVIASTTSVAAPVHGKLAITAPQRWKAFVWSVEKGFTKITTPAGLDVEPRAINDRGEVVGVVRSQASGEHAFIWSEELGFALLDSPGFAGNSNANAINASGEVTGWRSHGSTGEAFVWTRESGLKFVRQPEDADAFVGGISINNSGQVALHVIDGDRFMAFRWDTPATLDSLQVSTEEPHSYPVAINDAGDVLGYDGHWNQWDPVLENQTPILWTAKGDRIDIANCSRRCNMSVVALNNHGVIAGSLDGRAFRRSPTGEVETVSLSSGNAARGMNDAGDVVGALVRWREFGSWLWTADGKVIQLGVPPGATFASAFAINNKRQVVGNFQ